MDFKPDFYAFNQMDHLKPAVIAEAQAAIDQAPALTQLQPDHPQFIEQV